MQGSRSPSPSLPSDPRFRSPSPYTPEAGAPQVRHFEPVSRRSMSPSGSEWHGHLAGCATTPEPGGERGGPADYHSVTLMAPDGRWRTYTGWEMELIRALEEGLRMQHGSMPYPSALPQYRPQSRDFGPDARTNAAVTQHGVQGAGHSGAHDWHHTAHTSPGAFGPYSGVRGGPPRCVRVPARPVGPYLRDVEPRPPGPT